MIPPPPLKIVLATPIFFSVVMRVEGRERTCFKYFKYKFEHQTTVIKYT